MQNDKIFKWIAWLFLIIGIGLVIGAGIAAYYSTRLIQQGIRTTGNVVDFVESFSEDGTLMYSPIFVFIDENGQEHRVQSSYSSSSPGYARGQIVDIVYQPGKPDSARIPNAFSYWGVTGILGFIGIGFIFFGALTLIKILPAVANMEKEVTVTFGTSSDEN
jgi:Protein of unknown function (DUF3592)